MLNFLFFSLINSVYFLKVLSIPIETLIVNNELFAKIQIPCPSPIKTFACHASTQPFQSLSLLEISQNYKNFPNVNKNSYSWDFFYHEKLNNDEIYQKQLTFPIKSQAKYSVEFYCDDKIEVQSFNSPSSPAKIITLLAKYKPNYSVTNQDINNLICSLDEFSQNYNKTAYSTKYKECKVARIYRIITLKNNKEQFISLVPDWSKIDPEQEITQSDLKNILKKFPQLKSLEIFDKSDNWSKTPQITIKKVQSSEFLISPSLSINIESLDIEGYLFILIKPTSYSFPIEEELVYGTYSYYMKKLYRKTMKFQGLHEFKNYSLYYMTFSSDSSPNGAKSSIYKAFDFITTPSYNITFESSFIAIKAWSQMEFSLFAGIGDENNREPDYDSLGKNEPKDGNFSNFAMIGQKLNAKLVEINQKVAMMECYFYYRINKLTNIVNLWFFSESSTERNKHEILFFWKKSPTIEKMQLFYHHSFNVDPSEFLGFRNYRIKSNANGEIYAILIDNSHTDIVNREFIKSLVDGAETHEYKVIKTWKGEIKIGGYYEINYQDDEEDMEKDVEQLKEEEKYRLIFYGTSNETLKDSNVISRNFIIPKSALLYSCDDED